MVRIDALAYAQGYTPTAYACRTFGIVSNRRVVAFENSSHSSLFLWDDVSGITVNKNLASNFYHRYTDQVSTMEAERACDNYFAHIARSKLQEHRSGNVTPSVPLPYVLFLGQVFTDSSLVFGSIKGWGSLDVIMAAIEATRKLGHTLVIKLHPKEATGVSPLANMPYNRLTYRRLQAHWRYLDNNNVLIDTDNEYDTFALIRQAAAVITINSQAGLEASLLGKPVVVCGRSFYGDIGFTFNCPAADSMTHILSRALNTPRHERTEKSALARRFGAIYFTRYCRIKSVKNIAFAIACRNFTDANGGDHMFLMKRD
jgi:hypothetical protein